MRRLLDWERDAIVQAMADGEKADAIGAEFGVCLSYPGMLAKRRGLPPRSIRGRPKKPQLEKTVVAIQS